MTRAWIVRLVVVVLVVVLGQLVLTVLDYEPDPLAWSLSALAVLSLGWLALDSVGVGGSTWDEPLAPYARPDAAEDSVHHRVLTSHFAARDPGPELRRRLVALARDRDPDLRDPELRALADGPVRRLSLTDIDRYLTRIEETHEHH